MEHRDLDVIKVGVNDHDVYVKLFIFAVLGQEAELGASFNIHSIWCETQIFEIVVIDKTVESLFLINFVNHHSSHANIHLNNHLLLTYIVHHYWERSLVILCFCLPNDIFIRDFRVSVFLLSKCFQIHFLVTFT